MRGPTDSIHVLHVDNEPNFADMAAEFLEEQDDRIAVQTATSAQEGFDYLADSKIDCIVSDYDMPGTDGIEFLETVREGHPDLPFILHTGKGSEEIASEAISSGVTDYLEKGTGMDQFTILANRIRNAVESHKSRQRLEFLESLENQLTKLSRDLLQIDQRNIDTKINQALETIGTLVNADRSYVFQIDHDTETLSNTHEWTGEGVQPQIDTLQDHPLDTFPWWMENMRNHEPLTIPAVSDLPPEASAEQEILQEQDIKSLIVSPMISGNDLIGFIGFDWVEQQEAWSEDFIHVLQISGDILSSAIQRRSRRRELERREAYLEQSSDIISVIDSKGEVKYQSASTERVTDFSPAEVIGDSGFDHVHPDDLEKLEEEFVPFVSQPNTEVQEELRVETKDGNWRWIEVRGVNKLDDPVIDGLLFSSRDITERKEREQEIWELTERLELAVEGAELGVWDWDMTTDEVEFNEQWAAMLGYSLDELDSHLNAWEKRVHPDDLTEVEAALEAHLANETNYYDTEHRMRTADGDWKWIRDVGRVVERDDEGDPIRAVGIHQDINDRKEQELELRELKERYQSLIEYSSDIVTVTDEDGTVRRLHPAVEPVLGIESGSREGDSVFEYVHPEDREKVLEMYEEFMSDESESTKRIETRYERADGGYRWLESIAVDRTETPIDGYVIYSRDITERKERERELAAAREASQKLIEASPMPIWVQGVEEILYANDAAAAFFGHDDTESLVGTSALSYVPENQRERARKRNEQMLETGEAMGELSGKVIATEGTTREAVFAAAPITYYGEQAIVTIANDITERKEQEQQLRREKERLDEFASVVSHDLRNPLNVAEGRIDLAREECDTEHLDPAADGIKRGLALIEDMLALARGGQEAGEMEPVNATNLADACWDTVETADATVVVELESPIRADRTRLRQLLENLFGNAVEHGADDVTVRIGSLPDGFYVEDDGPGIPEGEREDVWEAGYSGTDEGTGFGLSIVQQIVDAHGWDIRITDGSDGGARFEITGVEFVDQ